MKIKVKNNLLRSGVMWILTVLVALFVASCEEDKLGEFYFVGDSLVAGWDVGESFPTYEARNDGVNGAHLEELLTWALDYRDKTIVMLIGTNNLDGTFVNDATRPQFIADFVAQYENVIQVWSPRRVFVISILPRSLWQDAPQMNACIKELNAALQSMAESMPYATFVDVYDDFLYNGGMNMNYSLDGLHLNDLGYNVLSKKLSQRL